MFSKAVEPELHIFRSTGFRSVVNKAIKFLKETPVHALPPIGPFQGVGVYILYYTGKCEYYLKIAKSNQTKCRQAIYVGKAVPPGWRAGRASQSERIRSLYGRLREHDRSIEQCRNLQVEDFRCRFMILEGIETDLISAVEAQLIRRFSPIWNTLIDGFGNHDPGSGRYKQSPSEWDVLHPGRPWAERLTGKSPGLEGIVAKTKRKK